MDDRAAPGKGGCREAGQSGKCRDLSWEVHGDGAGEQRDSESESGQ